MAITGKEVNLTQLSKELGGKGLIADFNDPKKKLILPAEGVEITDAELKAAIDSHNAIDEVKAKATAKAALLEKLGISSDEAALLLS
jgi:hypothetical protein